MSVFDKEFDELVHFARLKKTPGAYFGKASLLSLRDNLFGMSEAFSYCHCEDNLKYFHSFIQWYNETVLDDKNGYACWWNHILYTSGNNDELAFDAFFRKFEEYLNDIHGLGLPEVDWPPYSKKTK